MYTLRKLIYLGTSLALHIVILLALVLGLDMTSPLPVLNPGNKVDVISAVVLGDSPKSKILPKEKNVQPALKPSKKPSENELVPVKPEVIATEKREKLADDLLADIQKQNKKQKAHKQKQLQSNFEKTLHEQSEKTLREQLLDEDIHLKSKESRQAKGIINKYRALILQAISENWIIPSQSSRHLSCDLLIRLDPSGAVLDVHVIKSSGDPALDTSARAAVLKASPLPVPKNEKEFAPFRQFLLKVKPENILATARV